MYLLKTESFTKLFFLISFTGLLMYVVLAFYTFHTAYTTVPDFETYHPHGFPNVDTYSPLEKIDREIKYILIWTIPTFNVNIFGEGQEPFVKYNCSYSNCYLTTKSNILNGDYGNFNALILDVSLVRQLKNVTIPKARNLEQKIVFYSMTSANETPICLKAADNYFHWTWSYKLSSDIVTTYIEVTDLKGNYVAPKRDGYWPRNVTSEISESIMMMLQTKKKAVAWLMDTCRENVNRMVFVNALRAALKDHYLTLDIFTSGCGKPMCPNDNCLKMIEKDYYYYLAYEWSHAEDYVTDEVLKAYDHFTVPIVRGGADYSLFLPEGSYLDATKGTVNNLAAIIEYSIRNPEVYYSFHGWRNYFKIRTVDKNRGLCDLCENLNTPSKARTYTTYKNFRRWWYNGPLNERCFPKGAENIFAVLSYLNNTKKRS